MRCTRCGWPSDEAAVLSTHHTSQGWMRYRRCVCGDVSIELVTLGPAHRHAGRARAAEPADERPVGSGRERRTAPTGGTCRPSVPFVGTRVSVAAAVSRRRP